jgi:hypothetical protein
VPVNPTGAFGAGKRATPVNSAAVDQSSPLPSTATQPSTEIPQIVFFEFLFNNISTLNKVADIDDKAGNHSSATLWRTHDQRAVGLNDAEGQILQEITLDCLQALKKQDAMIGAFVEKDRAQSTPGAITPTPPELIQMVEDRKNMVSDHIQQLKEALGDTSFNKLDAYVHSSFHAEMIIPKSAPASIMTTGKSPKEN